MALATFWALFSQTNQVTLHPTSLATLFIALNTEQTRRYGDKMGYKKNTYYCFALNVLCYD
jgi:hypothetical protein